MKKIFRNFKTKTTSAFKHAYRIYSHGFTKFYGPSIGAGLNPFI